MIARAAPEARGNQALIGIRRWGATAPNGPDSWVAGRASGTALAACCAAVSIALSSAAWPTSASAYALAPWIWEQPPSFALDVLSGGRTSLADYRGRVVLVHFFATWCEPCRAEMASLQRLAERYDGQAVTILAVNVAEVEPRLRRFFDTQPVSFPVLLDRERAVTRSWKIDTLPTTVVLDRDLRPRFAVEADLDWDSPTVGQTIDVLLTDQDDNQDASTIRRIIQGRTP